MQKIHGQLEIFFKRKAFQNAFFLFIIFTISFIFRFYLADYTKHIFLYPDELRYVQLAENFANHRGFLLYNQATDYQKILYSWALMPAFFFESREWQQHALSLLNAFWACLSVFPCFLIAKKLLQNKHHIWFITIFSLFLPDLTFSLGFMSETLFLPLALFVFYLFLKLFDYPQHYFLSFLLGIFCYLLYLCKEIALVFPIAYFLFIFSNHYLKINQNKIIPQLKNFFILISSFLFCFVLFKTTIFNNMGNSYSSIITNGNLDSQHVFYLFYGFVYYLMNISLALFYFPFFVSLIYFKQLNVKNKEALLMLSFLIVLSAFVVSYTIFIIEDYPNLIPRSLIRYVTYIWLPIFIVFLSLLENKITNLNKLYSIFLILPILIILFSYQGSLSGFMDYNIIALLDTRRTPSLLPFYKTLLFIFLILFVFYFPKFKKLLIYSLFFVLFCFYIICNKEVTPLYWKTYGVTEKQKTTLNHLEFFIQKNSHKTFLMANTNWNKTQGLLDTFLNYPNVHVVQIGVLIERIEKQNQVNKESFPLFWASNYYNLNPNYFLNQVDYILLPKELNLNILEATLLSNLGGDIFSVFENHHPQILPKIELKE